MQSFDIGGLAASIQFSAKDGFLKESDQIFNDEIKLHEEFEVFFNATGDSSWLIENELHLADAGSLLIFSNQEVHKVHVRPDRRFERVKLLFNQNLLGGLACGGYDILSCFVNRPKGKGNVRKLSERETVECRKLFEKMGRAIGSEDPEAELQKVVALLEILMFTNRVFREGQTAEDRPESPEPLALVMRYIDERIDGDLSLETISRNCNLSKYHLCRIFKEKTGGTIHNYILYKRAAAAKRLMESGMEPRDVYVRCGFGAMSRFNAAFKKIVGMSPAAFVRKRQKLRKAGRPGDGDESLEDGDEGAPSGRLP